MPKFVVEFTVTIDIDEEDQETVEEIAMDTLLFGLYEDTASSLITSIRRVE